MSHLLYPIGIAEVEHEEHDTGWVACSDWTNQHLGDVVGGNVIHGLNADLKQLDVIVLWSPDGLDSTSYTWVDTSNANAGAYGLGIYQVSPNEIKVQTGLAGVIVQEDGGGHLTLSTQSDYYRVKVKKRQPTSRIVQNPNAAGVALMLHVEDRQAYNVNGGACTAGVDNIRDLNTVVMNEISGAILSGNQIILPAGTYDIEWNASAYRAFRHWTWLYDVTHAAILVLGTVEYAWTDGRTTRSFGSGRVTLTEQTAMDLRHRTEQTSYWGNSTNLAGYDSIYAQVVVRRIY